MAKIDIKRHNFPGIVPKRITCMTDPLHFSTQQKIINSNKIPKCVLKTVRAVGPSFIHFNSFLKIPGKLLKF